MASLDFEQEKQAFRNFYEQQPEASSDRQKHLYQPH